VHLAHIFARKFRPKLIHQIDPQNVSNGDDELPKSIVVTNVDHMVFDNSQIKVAKNG
jgi:hypothetical protein